MSSASSTSNSQRPRILLQFNQHKEGSVPTIRTVQDGPTTEEEYEEEDDEDDEVDQLLSTEDEGTGQAKAATSASAAGASKPRVRSQRPSVQPPIPLSRLESIIDSEIGEAMSKEALFVLSAATDAFIKRLADTGYKRSSTMKRATVSYHDVASVVHERHELHFLQETIPQPIGLEEALRLRDVKEKSLLEPLLSTPAPARPITISVPPQYPSLSITLPARSISASASASGSNAPSPRPAVKGTFTVSALSPLPTPAPAPSPAMTPIPVTTSTSISKPPPTKGKRKSRQPINAPAEPVVNSTPSTIPSETHPPTPANGTAQMPAPPPAETISAPAPPSQPRRMSMREPKPRRRPDDMEDHPRPPPAPPTSPVKESTSTNVAKTATGKTRQPRAKGKGKAKADAKPSPNATGKNGVNHTRTNGHAPTTGRVTRSRTGSAAVVPQMQAQVGGSAEQMVVDQSSGNGGGSSGEPLSGLGTGFLDGPVGSGVAENVGRTIYSSGKATDAESTSH